MQRGQHPAAEVQLFPVGHSRATGQRTSQHQEQDDLSHRRLPYAISQRQKAPSAPLASASIYPHPDYMKDSLWTHGCRDDQ
jgi:hypothetical protein